MIRIERDKEIHEIMVKDMADNLRNNNYNVKADHSSYNDKPEKISGNIPDIIARKIGNNTIIVEVETDKSYYLEHTKEQYKSFNNISGAEFHVVVPQSCLKEAKAKAIEWGIKIDKWWYHPNF